MEWRVIVCAACTQSEEVLCSLGDCFAEELDLEITLGSMELNGTMISTVSGIRFHGRASQLPSSKALTVTDMAVEIAPI